MRDRYLFRAALLLFTGAALLGCDSAPGPSLEDSRPPTLSGLDFSPRIVALSDVPENQIEGDTAFVSVSLSVLAEDPDGTVEQVYFVVQPPRRVGRPLIEGSLQKTSGGRFQTTAMLPIPTAEIGKYTILLYPVDDRGVRGNDVRGLLEFVELGRPPLILSVDAPDTIVRPGPGDPPRLVRIVVEVSDPDGLASISRVAMWNVNTPAAQIALLDDGGVNSTSGDETAGDGRYTVTLIIENRNNPGTNTFAFQAFDRAGLESQLIEQQIVVE